MLDLVFRNQTKSTAFSRAFFGRVLSSSIKIQKRYKLQAIPYTLSINLVGPSKIKALNKKYRQKDTPTDVISFPLYDKASTVYNKAIRVMDLGDIFICPAVVARRAKEIGQTTKQYMAWTTIHGFLHLLGYDHEKSAKESKKMFSLEEKILKKLD